MKYNYYQTKEEAKVGLRITSVIIALFIAAMMVITTGTTNAKELASGAPAPKPACSDVKSLSYKGDARVGELGFASIDINYSVSPCDKSMPVRVEVTLTQNIAGAVPVYIDSDAPLASKFTVNGILVNKSYIAKVTVYNASTGELVSSSQIFAAANRKVGV
jgi:hypothetical protein